MARSGGGGARRAGNHQRGPCAAASRGVDDLDYPIPRGAIAGYYPELNPLLPLEVLRQDQRHPRRKSIPVRVVASSDG